MADGEIPPDRVVDPWAKEGRGLGRDPERTPMPWDATAGPFLGFSTGEPWLPLASTDPADTVAGQLRDPDSVLSLYRRLIAYRRGSLALTDGTYHALAGQPEDCLVFERRAADQRLLVAVNAGTHQRALPLPGSGRIAIATERTREGDTVDGRIAVGPDEALVIELSPSGRW